MPLTTTFAGLSARALGFGANAVGYIYDNFLRTTSGTLGTATSGQTWIDDNGYCYAHSGEAIAGGFVWFGPGDSFLVSSDVIPFKQNTTMTVFSLADGANGVIFWRIDSNNWYAVAPRVSSLSAPTYHWSIDIFQCIAGTITTVANSGVLASETGVDSTLIPSIKVSTNGNNISVQAYSDEFCVTPLGSPFPWTYSGAKGIGVGIIRIFVNSGDPNGDGDTFGSFTAI